MKFKISTSVILMAFSASVFSQTAPAPAFTKEDYLQISKSQKTVAWALLGSGAALTIAGTVGVMNNGFVDIKLGDGGGLSGGAVMMLMGVILDGASIPFFVKAADNKWRAQTAFTMQPLYLPQKNAAAPPVLPAVKFTIRI